MKTIDVYNSDESVLKMLTQWDRDVYIYFRNDDMYKADEVHFFNSQSDSSYVVSATEEADGRIKVKIPNVLLEQPYTITALAFIEYDDGFRAGYRSFINVTPRPHPDNFISEDSEDYHMITELKKEVLEKMAEYAEESGRYYQPQVNSEGVLTWNRSSNSLPELPQSNIKGNQGDSGGFYTPSVSDDGVLSWTPSDGTMAPVPSANIRGSQGEPGKSPYIGDNNHWFVWDGTKWVDTKVNASGGSAGVSDYDDLTNKPTLNNVEISGDKTASDYGIVVPDVPDWALEENKPSYTAEEVGALPSDTEIPTVPTNVSAFENDAGYLTQHQDLSGKQDKITDLATIRAGAAKGATSVQTETDPTVPSWAKQSSKPSYNISEVGGSNPNLLDNPWFTVNQRGFTTLNGNGDKQYTVDRWYYLGQNNPNCTCSVNAANNITIHAISSSDDGLFVQVIDPSDRPTSGDVVTLSVEHRNVQIGSSWYQGKIKLLVGNAFSFMEPDAEFIYGSSQFTLHEATFSWPENADRIAIQTDSYTMIKCVKLERGSVSTLGNDSAPDYGTELLKCQRYFQSAGPVVMPTLVTQAGKAFQFHPRLIVSMASTPALSVKSIHWIRGQWDEDFVPAGSYTIGSYNSGSTTPGYNLVFSTVQTKQNLALYSIYIQYTLSADL